MKRSLAILLTLAMLLAMLAGCSGSGSTSTQTEAKAEAEAAPAMEALETVAADVVSGQVDVVNIANANDPTDLGPWAGNAGGGSWIIAVVYQTLQIREVNSDPEPCLAKSVTKVSDLVYDVELFDYITDSLGNPFTAKDAEFSINTGKELGKVAPLKVIDSVEVTGDYTFTVTFTDAARMGDFEGFFSQCYFVTQAAYEASPDGMATSPVGTSAYYLKEYTSGYKICFAEREDYWQTDESYIARSSEAHAKEINYYIITEASQRANAVEAGEVDYAAISYTDLDRIQSLDSVHMVEVPDNLTFCLMPNADPSAATTDQLIREAVFYALDNAGIAAAFSSGKAVPVYDLSNSNYPDYYEAEYKASAESNYYSYNPEKAMELLKEAGYEKGLTLRLLCSSDAAVTEVAQIIDAYLSAVGIDLEITALQGNLMSTAAEDPTSWDLYLIQFASTDYAVNVWDKLLNGAKHSWGGSVNFILSDELQTKLSDVRTESGHTKENVIAFHDYVIENAYGMGILQCINYFAVNNKIESIIMSDQRIIRPNACIYAAN